MKNKKLIFIIALILLLTSCQGFSNNKSEETLENTGQIYIYGEAHSNEIIMDKELELWDNYYNNEGMRHLFIEYPYYTAEFLNLWMESDNDDILNEIYMDGKNTVSFRSTVKDFFKTIKEKYPETIFHGTDIGHQYHTTGKRYLEYLEKNNLKDSEEYKLAEENIEQGKYFDENMDELYRENKMSENFIREFDKLDGESIMGIYGGAHIGMEPMDEDEEFLSMGNQLKNKYKDNIYSEDLSNILKIKEPLKKVKIKVGDKEYEASYYGGDSFTVGNHSLDKKFWRLENAYDDFKDLPTKEEFLSYNEYPMEVNDNEVFVIEYRENNRGFNRVYYRSDEGNIWRGQKTTVRIDIKE